MELKAEFVIRKQRGERMSDLCREFGISRKTGYKVTAAYERAGVDGLKEQSRAPKRSPNRTSEEIAALIIEMRKQRPTWGARKIKEVLETERKIVLPSATTIATILKRNGLIERHRRRAPGTVRSWVEGFREATRPNIVWGADYKGQFRLGDGSQCYPLTISDLCSRFVLCCEGMPRIDEEAACEASLQTFAEFGLPEAIRTDNGNPFASTGLGSLSKLSALWLRLGIALERIEPGQPQQNGIHERMHRTLKAETTRPSASTLGEQQQRFESFMDDFNLVRPHEGLGMSPPGAVYERSPRLLPSRLPDPDYSGCDDVLGVSHSGRIRLGLVTYHLTPALGGHPVGVREEDDGRWTVHFMSVELGHVDPATRTFQPKTL